LVKRFREAAAHWGGKVFACDRDPLSPALFAADRGFVLPSAGAPEFADALLELCESLDIRLLVPTRDRELPLLAALRGPLRDAGALLLAPSEEAIALCADKLRFARFCLRAGFQVARLLRPDEVRDFPVFARPRSHSGGNGCRVIRDRAELECTELAEGEWILQPLIEDPEFSIDVLMDLEGEPLQAVARRRLEIKAGEAAKSRVESIPALERSALALCARLGCIGHNNVQAFYQPGGAPRFIEVNNRFGGASSLAIEAGLDSPRRILQMLAGDGTAARAPRPIVDGLTLLRYGSDLFLEADGTPRQRPGARHLPP
jgi:carbamoyl-phosphate synthase large subunit